MNTDPVYSVYCHTNLSNGKQYIGITKRKPEKRWGINGVRYSEQAFGNAIDKYGWVNFSHEILLDGLTREQAEAEERRLIRERNTMAPNGYNMNTGGGLGLEVSDVTREKLRTSRLGAKASQQTREKISAIHKGKTVSEETKRRISDSRKGIRESDEWKQRIADGVRGHKWSDSQRENYMKSRIYAKGGECKTARHVAQYTTDGILVAVYGSVKEAQASIGNNHHISDCCNGKVKTAGGYVWRYTDK